MGRRRLALLSYPTRDSEVPSSSPDEMTDAEEREFIPSELYLLSAAFGDEKSPELILPFSAKGLKEVGVTGRDVGMPWSGSHSKYALCLSYRSNCWRCL
jgi:hypothetical protein